jgi:hypothetical protein
VHFLLSLLCKVLVNDWGFAMRNRIASNSIYIYAGKERRISVEIG